MKKLLLILVALLLILSVGCSYEKTNDTPTGTDEIKADTVLTDKITSDTVTMYEVTQAIISEQVTHTECTYCGEIKIPQGSGRWFIGTIMQSGRIRPLGNGCTEKVSAGTENLILHYDMVDYYDKKLKEDDIVRVVYSGEIMTSYPAQISAIDVNMLNDDLTLKAINHYDCDYCGKLDNGYRWFIAKAISTNMVVPIGEYCREAPGEIELRYSIVNGKEDKFMPEAIILVVYIGGIIETYPSIIYATYVEYHGDLEKTVEAAKNIKSSDSYKALMKQFESQ